MAGQVELVQAAAEQVERVACSQFLRQWPELLRAAAEVVVLRRHNQEQQEQTAA